MFLARSRVKMHNQEDSEVIKYLEYCLSFTALAYYVQQNNKAVNLLKLSFCM